MREYDIYIYSICVLWREKKKMKYAFNLFKTDFRE